ncbi:outer membrane protein [Pararhizobium sp.]|uniref:outer membrane protein n=1 Tax=Pararhizobium sp. TaxID=1977563 RepID=UPI00271674B2|nr:outer membrane protein [Pararhizobium sp.]MDO9415740.1 porin family protein [Pararhizobium sp.]
MKTILLAASAVLAMSGASFAADAVEEVPQAPIAVETMPVFTWSGPYFGIQGGGGWGDGEFSAGGPVVTDNFDGGRFGGFVGYNYQLDNNVVLGVEGDVTYNWNDNNYVGGVNIGTDWEGSVRARAGYAFDRALVYGTGGFVMTKGFIDTPAGDSSETFNGWTVGAGVDYAFTDMVFGRAEYRYNDFGSENIGGVNTDFDQHAVTVGLGVKF